MSVEDLPAEKIIARFYTVIDSDADGRLTKKEIEYSPLASLSKQWDKLNADGDGVIDRAEWTRYWAETDLGMSNAEFKAYLVDAVKNCGIDVSDLIESHKDLKAKQKLNIVPSEQLAARIYTVMDVKADGGPSKRDVSCGPLAEQLASHMTDMDTDADNKISVTEWNSFLKKKEEAFGADAYKQFLRDVVWEADVDCSDLVSADFKAVEKYQTLGSDALIKRLWDTIDSDSGGSIEKNEVLYSPFKEMLMPYWGKLDADQSGRVSSEEWNSFLKKLKQEKGEAGFNKFLAYMTYQGDVDVSDLLDPAPVVVNNAQASSEERQCCLVM